MTEDFIGRHALAITDVGAKSQLRARPDPLRRRDPSKLPAMLRHLGIQPLRPQSELRKRRLKFGRQRFQAGNLGSRLLSYVGGLRIEPLDLNPRALNLRLQIADPGEP